MSRSSDYNRTDPAPQTRVDDAGKDPATLEREIDQTRAQMDRTLGALERKLSPGQMLDEAVGMFKEHGGEFFNNLNHSIKNNPMPVILTAVGIGWMMMSSNRSTTSAEYSYDRFQPLEENGSETSSLSAAHEAAREKLGQAGDRIRAGADATRQKWTDSRDAVASGLGRTRETAQDQMRRARQGFGRLLEEQPLILGAVGIAVGAAIGAALPATEQEDRLLGETRDRALDTIQQRGAESYERVKETAAGVAEDVKQKISGASEKPESEAHQRPPRSHGTEL